MLNKILAIMALVSAMAFSPVTNAEIAVIVNPANSSALTSDELTRLYTGRSSAFTAINLVESSPLRSEFDEKGVGRSSAQLKSHWAKLVFTGKGTPPTELETQADVIDYVSKNINAIGYVDSANVTDAVKVILTLN
ncbi:phosphate ABC transporter substrate-binding protein [Rheinheimera sp. WS51]|uniref:phosphate ABC transporter substrate-binding protein n=1 Tax=Rheinheimera sp. WS51 TaxID=3425886 RepID=UPI003D934FF0